MMRNETMISRLHLLCFLSGLLAIAGCDVTSSDQGGKETRSTRQGPPTIVVSISPLAWATDRLVGDSVKIVQLMPEGADAARWIPDGEDLDLLATADLLILNGAGVESWAQRFSLPIARTVEVARSCRQSWLNYPQAVTHSHGPEGESSYEGLAGHTWLDPRLLISQAQVIRDRLQQLLPDQKLSIDEKWNQLKADLEQLGEQLDAVAAGYPGTCLLGNGPLWIYPLERMGWSAQSVDLDRAGQWSSQLLAEISTVRDAGNAVGVLLWSTTPDPQLVSNLKEHAAINSVVWPQAASLGAEYRQYLKLQQQGLKQLEEALSD